MMTMRQCRLLLIITVTIVFAIGLIMVFNTSSAEILDDFAAGEDTYKSVMRQAIYAALGIAFAIALWHIGYENILKLSLPLLIIFTILLALTFVPGIGQMRNGAYRWIGLGGYTIQPSEFVKFLVPMYYIYAMKSVSPETISLKGFVKIMAILAAPVMLIMLEPDNGTTGIIGLTMMMLFFATKMKARYWAIPALAAIALSITAFYTMPYVSGRIKVSLNPDLDILGRGPQPYQARIATGSGRLFGVGPSNSLQKLNYLPEAQNDYIAAIYAEEFGFVGIVAIITLYTIMAYLGIHIAANAKDKEAALLALTITFLIAFQAFLNLGVVSGLLPSTGLNLPFFSQGGTSLMTNIAVIGILLNIGYKSSLIIDH